MAREGVGEQVLVDFGTARAVGLKTGLETEILWSRSWSWFRFFRAGLGLGLEPWWSRSGSLKLVLRPSNFCK